MRTLSQAPARKSRFSLEGLQESRPARAVVGVMVLAAFAGLLYGVTLLFTGHFTDVVSFESQLPQGSNAVPVGAAVEYRDITVGKLASEAVGPNGQVAVKLDIYPANLTRIPAGVRAQVAPVSIFGNQYIDLVPPATLTAEHLRAGQTIGAYTASASTSLQGTTTQIYRLLSAIHPAALDEALTAFATALSGHGTALGHALDSGAAYFNAIAPHVAIIESDLRLTQPVAGALAASAPNLVGTLAHSSVTAGSITSNARTLHDLLTSNSAALAQLNGVLDGVQGSFPALANEAAPLLSDVDRYPHLLSLTLQGLGQWSAAWAAAESSGHYLSVTANLDVKSNNAAVDAALGYDNPSSIAAALGGSYNPATYSSANCPQYPGESNPYCGAGGSPDAQPIQPPDWSPPPTTAAPASSSDETGSGSASQVAASEQGSPAPGVAAPLAEEEQAADDIATALGGGQPPASPDVASVMLMPLLASLSAAPAPAGSP